MEEQGWRGSDHALGFQLGESFGRQAKPLVQDGFVVLTQHWRRTAVADRCVRQADRIRDAGGLDARAMRQRDSYARP